jgi:hypothetical protein
MMMGQYYIDQPFSGLRLSKAGPFDYGPVQQKPLISRALAAVFLILGPQSSSASRFTAGAANRRSR